MSESSTRTWKPCAALRPTDFLEFPVWTFDLERGEAEHEADETWVRPLGHEGFNRTDDELFVRAELVDRAGKSVPDSVLCVRMKYWDNEGRERKGPVLTGIVMLSPDYVSVRVEDGRLCGPLPGPFQNRLPFTYRIDVPLVARRRLLMTGTIEARR